MNGDKPVIGLALTFRQLFGDKIESTGELARGKSMFEFVTKSVRKGFGKGCETELGKVRSYRKKTASHNASFWNS